MRNESLTPEAVPSALAGFTPPAPSFPTSASFRHPAGTLVDKYGRHVTYLRLSITDRCDFRCSYCMAEEMTFLPRAQVLTLEECLRIASAFVDLGVTKVRVTGGEPLVRHNAISVSYTHLDVYKRQEQFIAEREDLLGVTEDAAAGVGEFQAAADAAKKLDAERFFEFAQLAADRLRGQVQLLAGASNGTGLGDHPEVAQMLVVERGHDRKRSRKMNYQDIIFDLSDVF